MDGVSLIAGCLQRVKGGGRSMSAICPLTPQYRLDTRHRSRSVWRHIQTSPRLGLRRRDWGSRQGPGRAFGRDQPPKGTHRMVRLRACKTRAGLPVLRSWRAKHVEHAGTFRTGAHGVRDVARGAPKIALLYGYLLTILNAYSRAFQKHAPLLFGVMVQHALGVWPHAHQVRGTARPTYRPDCGIPCLDPYPLFTSLSLPRLASAKSFTNSLRRLEDLVRFAAQRCRGGLLKAGAATCQTRIKVGRSKNTSLFDQLIRNAEQTRGDGEPERLGSLHVNGQLEFGRLQNRQIGRFSAH